MFSASDLSSMLLAFGDYAVIDDGTPAGKRVLGVFDNPFRRMDMALGIESGGQQLTVRAADVAGVIGHGVRVTISGAAYQIHEIQPDGQGLTVLILTER